MIFGTADFQFKRKTSIQPQLGISVGKLSADRQGADIAATRVKHRTLEQASIAESLSYRPTSNLSVTPNTVKEES